MPIDNVLETPDGKKLRFFMMSVKFFTETQPLVNIGTFVFITVDSDFTVSDILSKIKLKENWKMKELLPYPVEMHPFEFKSFYQRFPENVFDFTKSDVIEIKAESI